MQTTRLSLLTQVFAVFGLISVAIIYFKLLTPQNATYDARWYHLPMAEQYAVTGHVFRFDEGWFNGAMPHFASYLSTWAFLSPFGELFDRITLVAHLEFVLFVATLLSIPVLVDRLLPRPRLASAWVARFLFPGVMLYDSSLGSGADHALAFWGIPLFLALLRFWRRSTMTHGVLLANVIASQPMVEDIEPRITEADWQPKGTLPEKLKQTRQGTATFGLIPHDWEPLHGRRPVFGSLFLVAMALLLFVARRGPLFGLWLAAWAGVPLWFWSQHQDRYLQAIAPWCSVFVIVILVGVWRRFVLARPVVTALVAFQVLHAIARREFCFTRMKTRHPGSNSTSARRPRSRRSQCRTAATTCRSARCRSSSNRVMISRRGRSSRDATFSTWRAKFPTTTARFVRLRVPRRTFLHLEAVRVHP